ncbi:hypothetical protein K457DRAFT_23703 [Linnemannia elongata AG-77]|uniref:Chitin-binding type-1 domain-containing protein n=1 Tax=Linnemannia elongata AG-77 TaxID=1314771 RepID=A0A197JJV2_9FUNG|nr:hypothetical protein K457DRAFT_23703 [Linnemannia elongata AG-77]
MRSFTKVASFVVAAVAVLAILTPTSVRAQEGVYDKRTGTDGTLEASANKPFKALSEGPYPSAVAGLEKRAYYYCNIGYGFCSGAGGYCCPTGTLCFSYTHLCCDPDYPYTCNGNNCCLYDSCTASGACACPTTKTTCGRKCCNNGCDATGQYCACAADRPVDCGQCEVPTTTTTAPGNGPTNFGDGTGRSAGSVKQASAPFAAVMAAAAIVFGA